MKCSKEKENRDSGIFEVFGWQDKLSCAHCGALRVIRQVWVKLQDWVNVHFGGVLYYFSRYLIKGFLFVPPGVMKLLGSWFESTFWFACSSPFTLTISGPNGDGAGAVW